MSLFDRLFIGAFLVLFAVSGLIASVAAVIAVREGWRHVRFHLGRVPRDGAPLTPAEVADITVIRRRYRRWTPEPSHQRQEDDA